MCSGVWLQLYFFTSTQTLTATLSAVFWQQCLEHTQHKFCNVWSASFRPSPQSQHQALWTKSPKSKPSLPFDEEQEIVSSMLHRWSLLLLSVPPLWSHGSGLCKDRPWKRWPVCHRGIHNAPVTLCPCRCPGNHQHTQANGIGHRDSTCPWHCKCRTWISCFQTSQKSWLSITEGESSKPLDCKQPHGKEVLVNLLSFFVFEIYLFLSLCVFAFFPLFFSVSFFPSILLSFSLVFFLFCCYFEFFLLYSIFLCLLFSFFVSLPL